MEATQSLGDRIRYYRRRRGMSQVFLASLVGRSESWLSKVERGDRIVNRMNLLLELAHALEIELADLLGPAVRLPSNGASEESPHWVSEIRKALAYPDSLTQREAEEPVDLSNLNHRVEAARHAQQLGRYTQLGLMLPELLVATRIAIQALNGTGVEIAWVLLARSYDLTSRLCRKQGEKELAWIAADRAVATADRAGQPLLVASSAGRLAQTLLSAGQIDAGDIVVQAAASPLEAGLDTAPPEQVAVWGSLALIGSIAAARGGDVARSRQMLREAKQAATFLPEGFVHSWTAFSQANVALHEISAAVEGGNPVEALRLANRVDIAALPVPQRQARTWIDVARAHTERAKDPAAVAVLLEAERTAPGEVRHHRCVRELVRRCLRRERRSATPGLRGLAERIGVE